MANCEGANCVSSGLWLAKGILQPGRHNSALQQLGTNSDTKMNQPLGCISKIRLATQRTEQSGKVVNG